MNPVVKYRLQLAAFLAGAIMVGLGGISTVIILMIGDPAPLFLGNHRVNLLQACHGAGDNYKMAIVGGSRRGPTGLQAMVRRLESERVAFAVHTGNLVDTNNLGHYRWARWMALTAGPYFPLIVVPGDSDIRGNTHPFVKLIGPLEVAFRRGEFWFVTVHKIDGLEQRLKAIPDGKVVLVMHRPVWDVKAASFNPIGIGSEVVDLARKHRVRYVVSGGSPVYKRVQEGETVYIAQADDVPSATVFEVTGGAIADRSIEEPTGSSLWHWMQHVALGHVAETYRRQPVWTWGGTVIGLALWGWVSVLVWRRK